MIGSSIPFQVVTACATIEGVVAGTAVEAAGKGSPEGTADSGLVLVAVTAEQDVVAVVALEAVATAAAVKSIVAGTALKVVGKEGAKDSVIACAKNDTRIAGS